MKTSTGGNYQLILLAPGGGEQTDITSLVGTLSWSGADRQTARELAGTLAIPRDGSVAIPPLQEGAQLAFLLGGEQLFTGPLVTVTTTSQSAMVDFGALDNGRHLAGNDGWYSFSNVAPEAACAAIARDFDIPVDTLVKTGAAVSRMFPGVALDRIMTSLYALAAEKTGKRYHLRFTGAGRLTVTERPTAASMEVRTTMSVTNTWDVSALSNSVAIYSDDGALIRRIDDADSIALNGRLEHVITQRSGTDAAAEAKAWLADHGLQQRLTVEICPGDVRMLTGGGVLLRDTGSGVSGLFWIEGDTHTWKNGLYRTQLKLNFRQLTDDSIAGSAVS